MPPPALHRLDPRRLAARTNGWLREEDGGLDDDLNTFLAMSGPSLHRLDPRRLAARTGYLFEEEEGFDDDLDRFLAMSRWPTYDRFPRISKSQLDRLDDALKVIKKPITSHDHKACKRDLNAATLPNYETMVEFSSGKTFGRHAWDLSKHFVPFAHLWTREGVPGLVRQMIEDNDPAAIELQALFEAHTNFHKKLLELYNLTWWWNYKLWDTTEQVNKLAAEALSQFNSLPEYTTPNVTKGWFYSHSW